MFDHLKTNESYEYNISFIFPKLNDSVLNENKKIQILMEQLESEAHLRNALEASYLFNKLVSLCTKKGKKKMALKKVNKTFKLLKTFFRFSPIYFLKMAASNIEPFIFLHKIPRGNKETIYPRILPVQTRTHNALYLIAKQAFQTRIQYRYFYIALAHAILENSMPNNINCKKVKQVIEVAEMNKRNVKYIRRGKNIIPKIKRRDRFKLFKKINAWKN